MDKVSQLLEEIALLPEFHAVNRRSSSFLNDIAEIYERHGAGATRAYLLNQKSRSNRPEVPLLLKVIGRCEASADVRANRAIGRQIIKCLYALKEESIDDSRKSVSPQRQDDRTAPHRGEERPPFRRR